MVGVVVAQNPLKLPVTVWRAQIIEHGDVGKPRGGLLQVRCGVEKIPSQKDGMAPEFAEDLAFVPGGGHEGCEALEPEVPLFFENLILLSCRSPGGGSGAFVSFSQGETEHGCPLKKRGVRVSFGVEFQLKRGERPFVVGYLGVEEGFDFFPEFPRGNQEMCSALFALHLVEKSLEEKTLG